MMRVATCVLLFHLLGIASLSARPTRPEADLAIIAGQAYSGEGEPLGPTTILVAGGRITAVVPGRLPRARELIEIPEGAVMPGLIDARSAAGLPADPVEESEEILPEMSPLDMADPWDMAWHRALRSGITTAALVPGDRAVMGGTVAVVRTDPGLPHEDRVLRRRAALKATLGNEAARGNRPVRSGPPSSFFYRRPTNRMGVVAELRSTLAREDLPRGEDGRLLPVWFTAVEEQDLRTAMRLASEHELDLVVLEAVEGWKLADRLGAAEVPVVLGPLHHEVRSGRPEMRWNNAGTLDAAGVPVVLSTGGEDPASLLEVARIAVRYGLPEGSALSAITGRAARLLGIEDRVGDLSPGLEADLILLSKPPLDPAARVEVVVVAGRIAFEAAAPPPLPREMEER